MTITSKDGRMSTLTEFLLQRIAEDEAAWSGGLNLATRPDFSKLSRHMLAECKAKRAIVGLHGGEGWEDPEYDYECSRSRDYSEYSGDCNTLRALASVYADHADFDPAWSLA